MGKELELLQKMDLTAENRQKLETLITEAKKTGKVSSKHLVETLDDVDATQDQTEQFYNILEQSGIEIDVSDVLDLIYCCYKYGVSLPGSTHLELAFFGIKILFVYTHKQDICYILIILVFVAFVNDQIPLILDFYAIH